MFQRIFNLRKIKMLSNNLNDLVGQSAEGVIVAAIRIALLVDGKHGRILKTPIHMILFYIFENSCLRLHEMRRASKRLCHRYLILFPGLTERFASAGK